MAYVLSRDITPSTHPHSLRKMAKSPAQFVREVRQEIRRVVWPTRREVLLSTVMVLLLATFVAIFLTLTDQLVSTAIQYIIGVAG